MLIVRLLPDNRYKNAKTELNVIIGNFGLVRAIRNNKTTKYRVLIKSKIRSMN